MFPGGHESARRSGMKRTELILYLGEEGLNPAGQTQEGLHEESCRFFCIFVLLQARERL